MRRYWGRKKPVAIISNIHIGSRSIFYYYYFSIPSFWPPVKEKLLQAQRRIKTWIILLK
jgi:hypothetical protein